jgi:hypothetical protein
MVLSNNKHVFWEALVIAVFIFGVGILLGFFIENNRSSQIASMFLTSQTNLLDIQVQTQILNSGNLNCVQAVKRNIEFGDQIYQDAKTLKNYEDASRLSDTLKEQHKQYDTLRTLFWLNSIKIRDLCGNKFHIIVYLYNYLPSTAEEKTKQAVFSDFLNNLKQEKGNSIMLIPIARNLNISSLDTLQENYGINQTTILIDESTKIITVENLKDIQNLIK